MDLIKITDLTNQLGLSSRSLRYYEQVGLIRSVRCGFEKYRYYDAENIERLKQIIVLRKMQIPIKDIIRIYENADMSTVVEVFVDHINAINEEANSLIELRRIVSEFLQTMMQNGITKISAIPLLYEEMDKRLKNIEERPSVNLDELSAVSKKLTEPLRPAIILLPPMRVMSSYRKEQPAVSDTDGFWRWIQQRGLATAQPGGHEQFDFETDAGNVMIVRVSDDFVNDSPYRDYVFEGGFFATLNVYLDEDLGERFRLLVSDFDKNKFYEIDYNRHGQLRHPVLLENVISPDDKRELVSLFVPVKKRVPDPALFPDAEECVTMSAMELDAANPAVWETEAALDRLTPVNKAGGYICYETLPTGEVLFATYVGTRYLSTNIQVRLPFRVDVEFKYDKTPANADGAFRIYFGDCILTVNDENNADPALSKYALSFTQPLFGNRFTFPFRGRLKKGDYNALSWIVGETYLAAIVNGDVRLCLKHLPYMKTDFQLLPPQPIMINAGGDMDVVLRKINVSQLATKAKKRQNGEFTMVTRQSNNQILDIPTFCVGERGENFCFDGACERLMECLGEKDYGYWLIAGITGDCFAQVYPKHHVFYSDRYCVSDYHMLYDDDCSAYIEGIFDKLGYACTYVPKKNIVSNKEMYRQTLMAYIDKGIPVIQFSRGDYALICGYEEYGQVLLEKRACNDGVDRFTPDDAYFADDEMKGWIFVGEKKEQKILADVYRGAVKRMANIMTTDNDRYTFGAGAFRAWAEDIENGFYDGKTQDEVDLWKTHTGFVCDFETVAAKSGEFLSKALEWNPDLSFISHIMQILGKQGAYQIGGLEDLGGGFNVTLAALQDIDRRKKIADRLRLFAENMDEVVRILNENL